MNNRNNSECFCGFHERALWLLGRSLKGNTTWKPAEGEKNIVLTIFIVSSHCFTFCSFLHIDKFLHSGEQNTTLFCTFRKSRECLCWQTGVFI